jgi:hypothetical protein
MRFWLLIQPVSNAEYRNAVRLRPGLVPEVVACLALAERNARVAAGGAAARSASRSDVSGRARHQAAKCTLNGRAPSMDRCCRIRILPSRTAARHLPVNVWHLWKLQAGGGCAWCARAGREAPCMRRGCSPVAQAAPGGLCEGRPLARCIASARGARCSCFLFARCRAAPASLPGCPGALGRAAPRLPSAAAPLASAWAGAAACRLRPAASGRGWVRGSPMASHRARGDYRGSEGYRGMGRMGAGARDGGCVCHCRWAKKLPCLIRGLLSPHRVWVGGV